MLHKLFILGCIVLSLSGCAAAVIGGTVAGTSIALDNRTAGDFVEDQNIKTKFTRLYYQNKSLSKQSHINVTSYNRQILITGEVQTEQLKDQLSNIAKQIKNVRHYYNEVTLGQPSSMSSRSKDSYLTSKIKAEIYSKMKALDGAQIKVVTENARVFLMGLVTKKQGDQITEITRKTHGVERVIKLFEYPHPDDKRI